jgi:hypothetical protein
MSSQYSKWWWLGYFGVQTWTAEECTVRIALGMSTLPVIMLVFFVAAVLLGWVGVEQHVAAILAGLISVVPGFYFGAADRYAAVS